MEMWPRNAYHTCSMITCKTSQHIHIPFAVSSNYQVLIHQWLSDYLSPLSKRVVRLNPSQTDFAGCLCALGHLGFLLELQFPDMHVKVDWSLSFASRCECETESCVCVCPEMDWRPVQSVFAAFSLCVPEIDTSRHLQHHWVQSGA